MDDTSVRRLIGWNRFWLAVVVLAAVSWAGSGLLERVRETHHSLTAFWDNGSLRLRSVSDGPFLVTHLVFWGDGGPDKRYAPLPEPLVIIDSGGAEIGKDTLRTLAWHDWRGASASAPLEGAPVTALYYRPLQSRLHPQR